MSNAVIWWGGQCPPLAPMTALGEGALPGHLGIEFTDCGDEVWSIRIEDEVGKLVCISRLTMAVIPLERK